MSLRKKRGLWSITVTMLTMALVVGCSQSSGTETNVNNSSNNNTNKQVATTSSTPKDTLVVAMSGGIDTFDPAFAVGSAPAQTVMQNTFDQLTQYELKEQSIPTGQTIKVTNTEKVIGMLAEKYEVSEDGKTYTFHLRPNLKYHNGEPITAESILKGGFERNYAVKGIGYFLIAMTGLENIEQFSAPDPSTFVVKLSKPNSMFLMNDTNPNTSALDPKEIAAHATSTDPWAKEWFQKNMGSGSGPFIFESYEPGRQIVLKRNDQYWAGPAELAKVIILDTPNATQRIQMLERGTVDIIENPPVNDLARLSKTPGVSVYSVPSTRLNMLQLNTKLAPFDNVLVRQAVAYAVPYKELLEKVMHGYAQPATSLIPEGMPTHDGSYWKYQTDLDKAAELLAQAGYPKGAGMPPVKLSVRAGTTEDEQAAVFIQANLQKLGIKVQIESLPFATFNQLEQGGKLQSWFDFWHSWTNEPFYHLGWIVRSDSPSNYTRYNNATVDKLIAEYALSNDQEGREKASKQIQQILAEDVPIINLYQANINVAMRDNIEGYVYTNDQLFRFYHMRKK